jgi:hypothetical protein
MRDVSRDSRKSEQKTDHDGGNLLKLLSKFTQEFELIEPGTGWLGQKFIESDTLTPYQ